MSCSVTYLVGSIAIDEMAATSISIGVDIEAWNGRYLIDALYIERRCFVDTLKISIALRVAKDPSQHVAV